MRARAGRSSVGCLFALLLVVATAYFAINVGEVYLRYYRFRDAMAQQARFAESTADSAIITSLRAKADSLGLPPEAGNVRVRRYIRRIQISSHYSETVELPLFTRVLNFRPSAQVSVAPARPGR